MADTPIAVGVGALSLTGAAPTSVASDLVIQGDIVLPLFELFSAIDQGLTLPMFTVEATGLTGEITNVFQLPLALPFIEVEGTLLAGTVTEAEATLPMFELYAASGSIFAVTMPLMEVEATVLTGALSTSAMTLPLFEVDAVGQHTQSAVEIIMPLFEVTSAVLHGSTTSADISMLMFSEVATVLTGQAVDVDVSLPMFEVLADLYADVSISVDIQMPFMRLDAEAYSVLAATYRGYAMNLETEAVSTYSNYGFNSFAKIGDSYFAASSEGIFELTGDTDNGTAISAVATFKKDNFDNSRESRVVGAYLSADLEDDMRLSFTANGNEYVYEVPANGARGLVSRRIDTVKGERAIYWQASLTNVGGAYFNVSALEILAKKLARRV